MPSKSWPTLYRYLLNFLIVFNATHLPSLFPDLIFTNPIELKLLVLITPWMYILSSGLAELSLKSGSILYWLIDPRISSNRSSIWFKSKTRSSQSTCIPARHEVLSRYDETCMLHLTMKTSWYIWLLVIMMMWLVSCTDDNFGDTYSVATNGTHLQFSSCASLRNFNLLFRQYSIIM